MKIQIAYVLYLFIFSWRVGFALNEGEVLPAEVQSSISRASIDINGKVVLLDFWASWCTPCGLSLPWLDDLQGRWPGKVQVVTINVDKTMDEASNMLQKLSIASLPTVYDPSGAYPEMCSVKTMPSSFLFDNSHKLVKEYRGFREGDKAKIEADIIKLLEKESQR
jgi:thiol-disulfide isomerase/thioredoxin